MITNGFDTDDFKNAAERPEDGFFNLVHTGIFPGDGNSQYSKSIAIVSIVNRL